MCYSGNCIWENYMGDCRFPRINEVREKYPYPFCDIDIQDQIQLDYYNFIEVDIKKIINRCC